jgi:predicted AAA+ superfamily ATPase
MAALARPEHLARVRRLLRQAPVVALLGARQVGKSTLARAVASDKKRGTVRFFDLEDPRDIAELESPMLALEPLRGLVVLDEVQLRPGLFPVLRVLADRPRTPARFLVLGSATPELLRQGAETLAGRIEFHELPGFNLAEVGATALDKLWLRGGFPRSYLARDQAASADWRRAFVKTFLARDIPALGPSIPAATLERFWTMLAHYHGQIWNGSELGRSFGVSHTTVRSYLDLLAGSYVVDVLQPWAENLGKRVVKSPKVFVADSGLLHTLLGIDSQHALLRHPKLGASWEGFVIAALRQRLGARRDECFFWATHSGAELDLLVVRGAQRIGFEVKRTDAPAVTPSMRSAMSSLGLERLDVVHAGPRTFPLSDGIRAVAASDILTAIRPLAH